MPTGPGQWGGRRLTNLRASLAQTLPQPCARCGRTIHPTDAWVIGHKIGRATRPDLAWQWDNLQLEHRRCSDRSGQQGVQDVAYARGYDAGFADGFNQALADARSAPATDVYAEDQTETETPPETDVYAPRPEPRIW